MTVKNHLQNFYIFLTVAYSDCMSEPYPITSFKISIEQNPVNRMFILYIKNHCLGGNLRIDDYFYLKLIP